MTDLAAPTAVDVYVNPMNPITQNRRHYEDLAEGEVIDLGTTTVTKEMIVTFAREFDPFPFHLDEAAAKSTCTRLRGQGLGCIVVKR